MHKCEHGVTSGSMTKQEEDAPARPLYDEVERIRLDNGWTRTQVAKRAGVARGTIDNWRTQRRSPLAPTVKDVAERLGIDADRALRLAGILTPPPTPEPAVPASVEELTETVRRLAAKNEELEARDGQIEAELAKVKEQIRRYMGNDNEHRDVR